MGDINPSKVPKMGKQSPKVGTRKDGDKFDMYSGGGNTSSKKKSEPKNKSEPKKKSEPEKREKIFKEPLRSKSGLRSSLVGSGSGDQYGTSAGGRFSVNYPLDDSTNIGAYVEGYGVTPKGRSAFGDITGGGINLTKTFKNGGKTKSKVNEAGNYTKPELRKRIFNRIKAGSKGGNPGQWSARKAQLMAQQYKKAGGGYRD